MNKSSNCEFVYENFEKNIINQINLLSIVKNESDKNDFEYSKNLSSIMEAYEKLNKKNLYLNDELNNLKYSKFNNDINLYSIHKSNRKFREEIKKLSSQLEFLMRQDLNSVFSSNTINYFIQELLDSNNKIYYFTRRLSQITLNIDNIFKTNRSLIFSKNRPSQCSLDDFIRVLIQVNEHIYSIYMKMKEKFQKLVSKKLLIQLNFYDEFSEMIEGRNEFISNFKNVLEGYRKIKTQYRLSPTQELLEDLEISDWPQYFEDLLSSNDMLNEQLSKIITEISENTVVIEYIYKSKTQKVAIINDQLKKTQEELRESLLLSERENLKLSLNSKLQNNSASSTSNILRSKKNINENEVGDFIEIEESGIYIK